MPIGSGWAKAIGPIFFLTHHTEGYIQQGQKHRLYSLTGVFLNEATLLLYKPEKEKGLNPCR